MRIWLRKIYIVRKNLILMNIFDWLLNLVEIILNHQVIRTRICIKIGLTRYHIFFLQKKKKISHLFLKKKNKISHLSRSDILKKIIYFFCINPLVFKKKSSSLFKKKKSSSNLEFHPKVDKVWLRIEFSQTIRPLYKERQDNIIPVRV